MFWAARSDFPRNTASIGRENVSTSRNKHDLGVESAEEMLQEQGYDQYTPDYGSSHVLQDSFLISIGIISCTHSMYTYTDACVFAWYILMQTLKFLR